MILCRTLTQGQKKTYGHQAASEWELFFSYHNDHKNEHIKK